MLARKRQSLRYACQKNAHPGDSAGTHIFRTAQALKTNFLVQTPDRLI